MSHPGASGEDDVRQEGRSNWGRGEHSQSEGGSFVRRFYLPVFGSVGFGLIFDCCIVLFRFVIFFRICLEGTRLFYVSTALLQH